MCGISGIINKTDVAVNRSEIEGINNLIAHRGPDSQAYYFNKNFAFGHRRLSIIDLTEEAGQPMNYKDKLTIIYNGEIYNYLELRSELVGKGFSFKTSSDTEVILAAYDCFGFDCVSRFNGMWSFAIYDMTHDLIFCSRDRFGVKPFYFTNTDKRFVFGSEIKQLLYFQENKYVNQHILLDYLITGFEDHTNETFFLNINKLEQSHNLIYDLKTNHYSLIKYYELNYINSISGLSEAESVKHYREAFVSSVGLRLRSDVKVGTCLSGGLDSSSVASIASGLNKKKAAEPFIAITARSTESEYDETKYAKIVSDHSSLNLNIVTPSVNDFTENIDSVIKLQEEPFGSPSVFMQYMVFRKAKEIGCTVMLDGQGGDETLLGYERYFPAYLFSLEFSDMIYNFFRSSSLSGISKMNLMSYLIYFTSPGARIWRLKNRFSFIDKKYFNLIDKENIKESSISYRDPVSLQKLELMRLQLPHLLKYEDRNSMFHSIEARLPFIDYRVVEIALSLDNRFKINGGWTKYLLRKAMSGTLPDEIVWRKNKLSFNAPEKRWLDAIQEDMEKCIKGSSILRTITDRDKLVVNFPNLDYRAIWRLYNIAKWEEIFNVRFS
jgi:asparagine synthase (glutamine-hydrolysing)